MPLDDATAVAQARRGDREAFRLLVERHGRNMFKLAFRMTNHEQDAEEIVQETFLRAYNRIGDFESRSSFGTWLHRICANCALDFLAKRNRRSEQSLSQDPEGPDAPAIEIHSDRPGPERMALAGELGAKIEAAMELLSPAERVAFVMRHFEGESLKDIARALKVQEDSAKQYVFRAVQKMRNQLEPMRQAR